MLLHRSRLHSRRVRRAVVACCAVTLVVALTGCGGGSPEEAGATTDAKKVTVAGDSISVGVGSQLREAVPDDVTVKVIGEGGTGLARPDSFDWPARLTELARDFPPDVLVWSVSSNDAQDLVDPDGDVVAYLANDDDWDAEYSRRLAETFDAFEGTGTTIVWLGHVRTEEDRVGLRNRHIQELAEQVAADRDWVVVEDLADILGTGDDVASECLVADGLHLTVDCLDTAAQRLSDSLSLD